MVRRYIAVLSELLTTQRTLAVLQGDFAIHQSPHLRVGPEFRVSARVMRIVDAADTALADSPLSEDRLPAVAEPGVMNGTNLGATKPHVGFSIVLPIVENAY
jgi:hypothetical protein